MLATLKLLISQKRKKYDIRKKKNLNRINQVKKKNFIWGLGFSSEITKDQLFASIYGTLTNTVFFYWYTPFFHFRMNNLHKNVT